MFIGRIILLRSFIDNITKVQNVMSETLKNLGVNSNQWLLFATESSNCGKYWFLFCQGIEMKTFYLCYISYYLSEQKGHKGKMKERVTGGKKKKMPKEIHKALFWYRGVYYILDTRVLYLLTCSVMPILYYHLFSMRKADSQSKI